MHWHTFQLALYSRLMRCMVFFVILRGTCTTKICSSTLEVCLIMRSLLNKFTFTIFFNYLMKLNHMRSSEFSIYMISIYLCGSSHWSWSDEQLKRKTRSCLSLLFFDIQLITWFTNIEFEYKAVHIYLKTEMMSFNPQQVWCMMSHVHLRWDFFWNDCLLWGTLETYSFQITKRKWDPQYWISREY